MYKVFLMLENKKKQWEQNKINNCTLKISLFPDFFQRLQFSLTQSEILGFLPAVEENISPDHSWHVATMSWEVIIFRDALIIEIWLGGFCRFG